MPQIVVNDHLKISYNVSKRKILDLPNTLPYRYGPTLRIGFNKIAFVGFYSLTSVFKENQGTSLTPFNIGLSWMRL